MQRNMYISTLKRIFSIIHQIQIWKSTIFIFCCWCYFQMFTEWPKRFKGKKEYFQKREMLSTPFQVMFASENKSLCRFDTWHLWIVVVRLPLHKCLFLWRLTYFQGKTLNKRLLQKAQMLVTFITWWDTYKKSCVSSPKVKCWGVASHFWNSVPTSLRCPCTKLKSSIVRA